MKEISEIDPKWLTEIAPHFYQDKRNQIIQENHAKEI